MIVCYLNAKAVKEGLQQQNVDLDDTSLGETPLALASGCGHVEITRLLLGAKASVVTTVGPDRATALTRKFYSKLHRSAAFVIYDIVFDTVTTVFY